MWERVITICPTRVRTNRGISTEFRRLGHPPRPPAAQHHHHVHHRPAPRSRSGNTGAGTRHRGIAIAGKRGWGPAGVIPPACSGHGVRTSERCDSTATGVGRAGAGDHHLPTNHGERVGNNHQHMNLWERGNVWLW